MEPTAATSRLSPDVIELLKQQTGGGELLATLSAVLANEYILTMEAISKCLPLSEVRTALVTVLGSMPPPANKPIFKAILEAVLDEGCAKSSRKRSLQSDSTDSISSPGDSESSDPLVSVKRSVARWIPRICLEDKSGPRLYASLDAILRDAADSPLSLGVDGKPHITCCFCNKSFVVANFTNFRTHVVSHCGAGVMPTPPKQAKVESQAPPVQANPVGGGIIGDFFADLQDISTNLRDLAASSSLPPSQETPHLSPN